jgi:hypothetical protein
MSLPGLALLLLGAALIVLGVLRARDPYRRYMALREQDENIARYEAWRGGPRADAKTGASIAMQLFRRRAQVGGAIAIAGAACVVAGFILG